jgi:large subunit ribosomal protein L9
MKVILLEDIVGAGSAGDVVEVKNGYARNKLLPSGMAIEANKTNMKTLEHRRAKIAAKKAADVDIAQDLAVRLDGKQVDFIAKAGEAGKLFGSITAHDIAAAVTATTGFEIDRRKLLLDAPIKQIGMHEVRYRIYAEVEAVIKVNVLAEGGSPSTEPQEEIELEIVEIKPEDESDIAAEEKAGDEEEAKDADIEAATDTETADEDAEEEE